MSLSLHIGHHWRGASDVHRWAHAMPQAIMAACLAAFLSGCACHPVHDDSGLFWRSYHSFDSDLATSASEEEQFIRVWNEQASSDGRDERSFLSYLEGSSGPGLLPPIAGRYCRMQLGWTRCESNRSAVSRRIPVELLPKGATTFSMAVLPEPGQSTGHYIWFTLLGVELGEGCRQKALDFWKGNLRGGAVRLHEVGSVLPTGSARQDRAVYTRWRRLRSSMNQLNQLNIWPALDPARLPSLLPSTCGAAPLRPSTSGSLCGFSK